jgi:hypothetical protein
MKMMKFASEKAMALVDGQLAPAEAPAVIQEIAATPALMRLVQKYLAVNPWKIRQLYKDFEQEPVPDRLMATVLYSPMGEVRRRSPGFVEKLAALAARTRERYTVPGWSLAAGPALAGALVAVSAYTFMPTASVGAYADAGMIVPPLETTASGSSSQLVVRPILTYRNKSDEFCRQFEVKYGEKQSSHAVACLRAGGNWQMMMATPLVPTVHGYAPVGEADRKSIDDYVGATIVGAHLETPQESNALQQMRELRREALTAKRAKAREAK